jgi:hypothetical protein
MSCFPILNIFPFTSTLFRFLMLKLSLLFSTMHLSYKFSTFQKENSISLHFLFFLQWITTFIAFKVTKPFISSIFLIIFTFTVQYYDLREPETYNQIFDSLEHLGKVVDDVFSRIAERVLYIPAYFPLLFFSG